MSDRDETRATRPEDFSGDGETVRSGRLHPPENGVNDATRAFGTTGRTGASQEASSQTTPGGNRQSLSGLPIFQPGDVVAERYTIVQFLAQGGMGEVYEADDAELGERVALKTVRTDIAADPRALDRFKREVLLARKVSHPNVCRIFDLGHHRTDADAQPVTFLTMELLLGESLAERLRRTGQLAPSEALPIIRDMAAGIAVAHQAGVVHRDLKPQNVMLVSTDQGGVRAVVTDFGLARADANKELSTATGTGEVLGTPAYMAPEQLTDGHITSATDIYAFGLVIYEMLTGLTPFQAETPFLSALKRLQEKPVAPSVHVENFDLNWEQSILRCLEREPSRRFESALDVVKSLQGEDVPLPPPTETRGWTRHLLWAAPVLLVGAIAGTWWLIRPPDQPATSSERTTIEVRPSVAVLGFRNTTGNEEMGWISTALSEMLTTELSLGEAFRTVPGEIVARTTMDIGIDEVQTLGPETLGVLRQILGSDLVVLGSYTILPDGEQIRLDVRAQNTASGETAATSTQNGTTSELFSLISEASSDLRSQLGAGVVSAEQVASAQASLPTSSVAARYYSEGLEKLRAFDTRGGIELLEKAVEADPDSPMAHLSLANAWSSLGYERQARTAAEQALALSDELPREERLRIEAVHHKLSYQHDEAVRITQSLWTLFPDNRDYGVNLAQAQMRAGRPQAALQTVNELRRLPPPENEHPRIDLTEASAAAAVGDAQRQLEAATRAADKGAELGARLLQADAMVEQADALTNLGQYEQAITIAEEAEAMYMEAKAPSMVFQATLLVANALYRTGEIEQALGLWQSVLQAATEIGNRGLEAIALNNIASAHLRNGDLPGARERLEQVLLINRETGNLEGEAQALNNLSITDQWVGELSSAIDRLQQSLALRREMGDRRGEALNLKNIANVYYARGELADARTNLEKSLAISRQVKEPALIADTLHSLGDVLIWEGDLGAARERHSEALQIRMEIGADTQAQLSRFSLAGLRVEEARLGQAETSAALAEAQAVVEWASSTGHADTTAAAYQMLADAALISNDTERAAAAIKAAAALEIQDVSTRVFFQATAARVQAAQGDYDTAIATLDELVTATANAGIPGNEYESRYALADVQRIAGRPQDARRTLERLQRDAAARGFHLAARKASQMLEQISS